jgi:hypothetical protein
MSTRSWWDKFVTYYITIGRVHATTDRLHATIGRVPVTIGRVPRTVGRRRGIVEEYYTCLTPYRAIPSSSYMFHRRIENV